MRDRKKYLKYQKKYYQEHKEEAKRYYQKYKNKIKAEKKLWRQQNPEYTKKYYLIHKKKIKKYRKEYDKKYRIKNKFKLQKYGRNYRKNRFKNDIKFKIICNIRNRMNQALKNNCKKSSTIKLLNCTIPELKKYLEKQFKKRMFWSNYGKIWEIDHIKPCASFDLTKISEQKRCFHYTNLRPLTIHENRIRRRK